MGHFPRGSRSERRRREAIHPLTTFGTCLAFASIPFVLATAAAILRFGSKVSIAKIVGVLVIATSATPM
jgi:hypothetical protein